MPRYDYKCPKCGGVLELVHDMDEVRIVECVDCNVYMEKQISVPNIQFKGSGFYINDYKGKG